MTKIFLSLVTWNSEHELKALLPKLVKSAEGIARIFAIDNNSSDKSVEILKNNKIEVLELSENKGFAGGQNEGIRRFLSDQGYQIFCTINPDVELDRAALLALSENKVITPKILRLSDDFSRTNIIDAAGMILTPSLRHLDRGSNEEDKGQYDREEEVFGGTGAFLAIPRQIIEKLKLRCVDQFFDEAFFAYREDADLAWRMRRRGIVVNYEPKVVVYHQRKVLPENRKQLSQEINRMSVRNRFLLQINNWKFSDGGFIQGIIFRNLLVILGVIVFERSSFAGLVDLIKLLPRALKIRKENIYG